MIYSFVIFAVIFLGGNWYDGTLPEVSISVKYPRYRSTTPAASKPLPSSNLLYPQPLGVCPAFRPIPRRILHTPPPLNDISNTTLVRKPNLKSTRPKNTCPPTLPIERYELFPVTTLNNIARFVVPPVVESQMKTTPAYQSSIPHPPTWTLLEWFCNLMSVALISLVCMVYLLTARLFWNLHYSHDCLYGQKHLLLARRQWRRIDRLQRQKLRQHGSTLAKYRVNLRDTTNTATSIQMRLDDAVNQNKALISTLQSYISLKVDLVKQTQVNLQLESRIAELQKHYDRKCLSICELKFQLADANQKATFKARRAMAATIKELRSKARLSVNENAGYEVQMAKEDFDAKLYEAAWIQKALEDDLTRKDEVIARLQAEIASAEDKMDVMSMELQHAKHKRDVDQEVIISLRSMNEILNEKATCEGEEIALLNRFTGDQSTVLQSLILLLTKMRQPITSPGHTVSSNSVAVDNTMRSNAEEAIPPNDFEVEEAPVVRLPIRRDIHQVDLADKVDELAHVYAPLPSSPPPPSSLISTDEHSPAISVLSKNDHLKDDQPRGLDASIWAPRHRVPMTALESQHYPLPASHEARDSESRDKPQRRNVSMWAPKAGSTRTTSDQPPPSNDWTSNRRQVYSSVIGTGQPGPSNGRSSLQTVGRVYNSIGLGTRSGQASGHKFTEEYGNHFNTPKRRGPQQEHQLHDRR